MGVRKALHRYGLVVVTPRAQGLRRRETPWEAELWKALRDRRDDGIKFRRQHPIGPYVVDFYCAEHKLVIELDGSQHRQRQGKALDAERDEELSRLGLTVLRFPNETSVLAILAALAHHLPARHPRLSAQPMGEGQPPAAARRRQRQGEGR
jgi:very-short-patch-repair endonuclease